MKAILKMIAVASGLIVFGNVLPAMASKTTHSSFLSLKVNFMEMQVSEFITLSVKDFSTITGEKMNLKESISFSLLKKSMKKSLKSNPDQTVKNYLATVAKKNNTALIIIIVVVVIALVAVIIASSINIGPTWPTGG